MTSTSTDATSDRTGTTGTRTSTALYSSLIGLAATAVLLQGGGAGLFVREGQDYTQSWVEAHARGADVAILLAVLATAVAVWKHRQRRDLIIGSAALTVLLVVEAYIGGLIGAHSGASVIHFPIAMALMGLAVWLPFRAVRR